MGLTSLLTTPTDPSTLNQQAMLAALARIEARQERGLKGLLHLTKRLERLEILLGVQDDPAAPSSHTPPNGTVTPAATSLSETVHDLPARKLAELRDSERQIIAVLRVSARRMTRTVLLRRLDGSKKIFSDSTLRTGLERLGWYGFVDNDPKADPPGYGLTSKCPAE